MLDIKRLRNQPDELRQAIGRRGVEVPLDEFNELDRQRRQVLVEVEEKKAIRNRVSGEIAAAKRAGEDAAGMISDMKKVGEEIKALEIVLRDIEGRLEDIVMELPNPPLPDVPTGRDESANITLRTFGEPTMFAFEPKAHWDIGADLGIIDQERGTKVAESRFTLLRAEGARLERSLINFFLDLHTREHGYTELFPPILVNSDSMRGTGQLSKFAGEEMYKLRDDDLYLNPTAEVPITNLYRDETLPEEQLPIRVTAYLPSFRREAGAAGRDTRGLIRQHQFNKVELVKFVRPETSTQELESLTLDAEEVLKRLELPFRTVTLCTGDLGFASAKTYDLEVWLPSYDDYKEISSCSNFLDFQARRLNIRYRSGGGKPRFIHTLNGSGLAVGRTFAAVLENYQNEDGSVTVPQVLREFMGVDRIG
ncbi:serine--tRNA ligase [bacterium BMS3Abin01]|nr:serine--tRNA ligase [bacterium BMS3Abin01]HDZ59719.1 serine--tRNA ligase [Actinomycetota bacterium]